MSACFYIVVEGEDPGYDIFVNGHMLARYESELEQLAAQLGVPPLLEFFSADRNSMAMLLEQGAGDPQWEPSLPDPQWFFPTEGLQTINALLEHFSQRHDVLGPATETIEQELREYRRVLEKTVSHGLRWHLAVSWE